MYGESKKEEGRIKGRIEGRAEGRVEGIVQTLWQLVQKKRLTKEEAASEAGLTPEEFDRQVRVVLSEPTKPYSSKD